MKPARGAGISGEKGFASRSYDAGGTAFSELQVAWRVLLVRMLL
jgi:hypothetical protein